PAGMGVEKEAIPFPLVNPVSAQEVPVVKAEEGAEGSGELFIFSVALSLLVAARSRAIQRSAAWGAPILAISPAAGGWSFGGGIVGSSLDDSQGEPAFFGGGSLTVKNAIIAGNTAMGIGGSDVRASDSQGTILSQGHNLVGIGDGGVGFIQGVGDLV